LQILLNFTYRRPYFADTFVVHDGLNAAIVRDNAGGLECRNTMSNPSDETFLEFASRGKTAWWRYLLSCVLAFLIAVILGVAITFCLQALHKFPNDFAAEVLQPSHPLVFFVGTGAIFGTLVIGLIIAMAVIQHKKFGDVVGRWNWRLFFWAIVIWATVEILASLLDFLIAPHSFRITVSGGTLDLAFWALLGLSVQTFAEEFIFRGYLTQAFLLATKNPLAAALISGFLFGAMHVPNGAPQAVSAACFGIVTSLIAIRTGGIAFTFGLHLTNNLFGAVILVSSDDVFQGSSGLISQNTPQLMWWDVGVTVAALVGTLWLTTRLAKAGRPFLGVG
jgi:membrane protease YdiL (CAAX protease family)